MKDENQLEKDITKALKFEKGHGFEWIEWGTSEETIKGNLQEGEEIIKLLGLWIAYRKKNRKDNGHGKI